MVRNVVKVLIGTIACIIVVLAVLALILGIGLIRLAKHAGMR